MENERGKDERKPEEQWVSIKIRKAGWVDWGENECKWY
jgi:hypothetical protein